MANLTEVSEFTEGIYRIELTDYAEGGEEGLSNRQAKQLANRTQYLKNRIDEISSSSMGLDSMIYLANALVLVANYVSQAAFGSMRL